MHRSALVVLLGCALALGCDSPAAPDDATSTDGGRNDAARLDTAGLDVPATGAPIAAIVPAPPRYWYLEAPTSLTIGGPSVVAYRARFDEGAFGPSTPIATLLALTDLAPGWHDVAVIGGDGGGTWQDEAAATTARFYLATTEHEPIACTLRAAGGPCDLVLAMLPDTHQYFASATADPPRAGFETPFDLPPGSVICLPAGTTRSLSFRGVEGTPEAPYTFTNCGGVARIALRPGDPGGRVALQFAGSHHLRIVGTGSSDERGIVVASGGTTEGNHAIELKEGSSDFEIAFVEIESSAYAGIAARTDVSCRHHRASFVQANTFLHDLSVHDTAGEGFYVGGSHWRGPIRLERGEITCGEFGTGTVSCDGTCRFEAELHGVRIYRNRVERTDADGIQLSSATYDADGAWDVEVWGNEVIDAATGGSPYNSGGITIQSGASGRIHHNYIEGCGAYAALNLSGLGHFVAYDNVIYDAQQAGIVLQDDDAGDAIGPFVIVGNTISGTVYEGVYAYTEHSTGNFLVGNLIVGTMGLPVRRNAAAVDLTERANVTTGTAADHFVSEGIDGFRLRTGSNAIGGGEDLAPWGVLDDYYGAPRTAPYDVGAVASP